MKKHSLILVFVMCAAISTWAQRTITGTILDDQDEPLIGATVSVPNSAIGTVTDFDGKYSIEVPDGTETLVVSYTGYATKTLALGTSNVVDVVMSTDAVVFDEVVVTAAGLERNSRDVVYANQTVDGDALLSTPNKNTLEALRGKTAGVRLSTGSGSVGASTRIVLRGESSLTGDNNALIVVDGIPIDNGGTIGGAGTSTAGYADHGNRFNDINPEDIESVTILKGPSATSLYGSRGAAGVVLVTTKSGKNKEGKIDVGINSSYSVEKAYILLQRQDQFGQGFDNSHFDSGENWSWGPAFDGVVRPWTTPIDSDGDGALESLVRPFSAAPDQLQEFFNLGNTLTNSFYLSGGNEGFTYYASYSNTDQDGILDNTKYKRNTVTFNSSAKLSDRLSSNFKISYANTIQNTAQEGSRAFEGNNAYAMAVQSPVNIPFGELRDYNSPFHDIDGYWGSFSSVNPYFILNEYGNEGRINNFLGNASLTYNLAEGLNIVGRFGTNVVTTDIETFSPSFDPAVQLVWGDDFALSPRDTKHESLGDYSKLSQQNTNLDFTGLLTYNRAINDRISLDFTGGYNFFQTRSESVTGSTQGGLVVAGFYNLSNSAQASISEQSLTERRIFGVLGNVRLGLDNALFLEYSARNDWSSTLPESNRSFFYNAVGVSAVLTDLLDIENDLLSFAKFRASFGTTGKDASPYLLASTFVGNPVIANLNDFTLNFPLNGQAAFTAGNLIGNPSLGPELTTTFEVGADLDFWEGRVNLAYTYYYSDHTDQIVQASLPRSSGFTNTFTNIGRMTNRGHEVTLNLKPIVGLVKGLTWDLFVTYATNENEVKKITDEIDELIVGGPFNPGISVVAKEGLPFGTFKGLVPKTNEAGSIIVDANTGYPLPSDEEQFLDSYQPDFIASVGSTIGFKGVSFNFLVDIRQGGSFVSQTQNFTEFNGTNVNTIIYGREPYVFPNAVIENADGTFRENDIEITEQDYFTDQDPAPSTYLVDASFVKLREVGVSYTLPASLLKDLPIADVRISFFGRNLKFWLPDSNIYADPEINGPSPLGNAVGIETTQVPPAKSFGVNLGLKF